MKRSGRIPRHVTLAPRSTHRATVKELDALCRRIVLERDGHRCRRCNAEKRPGQGGGIQAAHILPKGSWPTLRFELLNILALCASCHMYGPGAWHKDPDAASRWINEALGENFIPRLRELSRLRSKTDRAALKLYLEARMPETRSVNETTVQNAKIVSTFLGVEDHGILTAMIQLAGDGWGVGFGGWAMDEPVTVDGKFQSRRGHGSGMEWVRRVLDTLELSSWEKLPGALIRVENEGWGGKAVAIGHAIKDQWFRPASERPWKRP